MDDLWRLRLHRDGFQLPDPGPMAGGAPAFLGLVASTGTNLGVGKFMKVNPVAATGAETEGGAGTLTADTSVSILVYACGPSAPVTGDYVVCRHVNHRWVAGKQSVGGGSGGFGTIPTCQCLQIPSTLTLTSCDTTVDFGLWQPATIAYGPPPAGYTTLGLGTNAFLSTTEFHDSSAEASNPTFGPIMYRWHLFCSSSTLGLTQVYASSPFGSPYQSGNICSWGVPTTHNSCHPYLSGSGAQALSLADFVGFPGHDPAACMKLYGGTSGAPANCYSGGGSPVC